MNNSIVIDLRFDIDLIIDLIQGRNVKMRAKPILKYPFYSINRQGNLRYQIRDIRNKRNNNKNKKNRDSVFPLTQSKVAIYFEMDAGSTDLYIFFYVLKEHF